jgi:protein SCO1
MSKKRIFYFVFFAVLVLSFFFALSRAIPGFFNSRMPPISTVQPFAFTNQLGKTVTDRDVLGKVNAVNFFFTTCKGVCPRMNNNFRPVYEKFKSNPGFLMLSYTCDPSTDSVPVLKRYADSIGADPSKWIFLTGQKDSLYAMARHSYAIDDPKTATPSLETDFLHTQFIALVNRKGEVVKVYDGIKPSEVRQLEKDIETLLKE